MRRGGWAGVVPGASWPQTRQKFDFLHLSSEYLAPASRQVLRIRKTKQSPSLVNVLCPAQRLWEGRRPCYIGIFI